MSNSLMNHINITNPIVYKLNLKHYMLSCNVTTKTMSSPMIDLSVSLPNDTIIISSNNTYNKFYHHISNYVNKNTGQVKFYSYAGGKEITKLVNGINKMSNLPYPPFNNTLFSSIILPEINNNDSVYILIDSYNEINSITCPLLMKKLINRDLNIMLNNIKTNVENKNVNVIIMFDTLLYDELINYEPDIDNIIQNFNFTLKKNKNLVSYTFDLVFGKVISSEDLAFNGIIDFENFTIYYAFTTNQSICHLLTIRTSGLSIIGNGTSNIYVILSSNNCLPNEIKITDVTSENKLLNVTFNENIQEHKNTDIILKLIELCNYNLTLSKIINTDNKDAMKHIMHEKLHENFQWEFNFLNTYDLNNLEEDIKTIIDAKIRWLHNILLNYFAIIRSKFHINKLNGYNYYNLIYRTDNVLPTMERNVTAPCNNEL